MRKSSPWFFPFLYLLEHLFGLGHDVVSVHDDTVRGQALSLIHIFADELGNPKVANLVMAGAYIGYTELLPPEKVLATAFKKLGAKRPELNPLNEAAFNRGMEIGKAAKK